MIRWVVGRAFLLLALAVQADTLTGRVVCVVDGDKLTVLAAGNRPVKVRLAGIDAPEHDQPFGQRSRQSLSERAFGQAATYVLPFGWWGRPKPSDLDSPAYAVILPILGLDLAARAGGVGILLLAACRI